MTVNPRYFRPMFLVRLGSHLVAVDEMQPVAVVLDRAGSVVRRVDWTWTAGPRRAVWRPRDVAASDTSVWVDDGAESDVVRIDFDAAAVPTVQRVDSFPGREDAKLHPYGLWRTHLTAETNTGTWHTRSALGDGGVSWYSTVEWQPAAADAAETTCDLGYGSVHAATALGEDLFIAVRRAGKRPWTFRPPVDLLRIDHGQGAEPVLKHDQLDVRSSCRDLSPHAPSAESIVRERLNMLLQSTGAEDPDFSSEHAFTVRHRHTDPVLELSFNHLSRPGLRLVRLEHLRTEFGFPQSEGDFGIFLDEDLIHGFLPPADWAQHGVLHI